MSKTKKEYNHEYYLKNKDKLLAQGKKYREDHPEEVKEYNYEYYLKNRDKLLAQKKKYNEEHPEEIREHRRKYRAEHPEKIQKHKRKYYQEHAEECRERSRKYREEHPEKEQEHNQKYRVEHPEEIKEYHRKYNQSHKQEINEYYKQRRKKDIKFKINKDMTTVIWKSLKGNKSGRRWEDLVGYTVEDLIKRLKKTLPKGYTWEDYLQGKLHIDHIVPISAFNYTSIEHPDFRHCWALENLRLLPAKENIKKSNHLAKPFQPALKLKIKGEKK